MRTYPGVTAVSVIPGTSWRAADGLAKVMLHSILVVFSAHRVSVVRITFHEEFGT